MSEQAKDLAHYLSLPYTEVLRRDDEGDFVARVEELQGCLAHGETREEAIANLQAVKELWVKDALQNGDRIPEPAAEEDLPSGKWVQRVPRSLHRKLVALAKREATSLNQLVVSVLSAHVGSSQAQESHEKERERLSQYMWTRITHRGTIANMAFGIITNQASDLSSLAGAQPEKLLGFRDDKRKEVLDA
jgi:predicted RNase H-like HicB family nuclease